MSETRGVTDEDIIWAICKERGYCSDEIEAAMKVIGPYWQLQIRGARAILALAAERVEQIIGDHNMNAEREPLNPEVICKQHMAAEIRRALLGEKG